MAHPFKGVPRSEWPRVRAEMRAAKAQAAVNALEPEVPSFAGEVPKTADVPRATLPPKAAPKSAVTSGFAEPVNLFSGTQLRLKIYSRDGDEKNPVPGFRTYWFEDDETMQRVTLARRSGWLHVECDEILMHDGLVPGNNDLGTSVSIGIPGSSPPRRMYLMKQPLELAERFAREREERVHGPIWEMLKGNRPAKGLEGQYGPGPGSAMPKTKVGVDISSGKKG